MLQKLIMIIYMIYLRHRTTNNYWNDHFVNKMKLGDGMYILFLAMFALIGLTITLVAIGRANIYFIVIGALMMLSVIILSLIEVFSN